MLAPQEGEEGWGDMVANLTLMEFFTTVLEVEVVASD